MSRGYPDWGVNIGSFTPHQKDMSELDIIKSDLPRQKVDECYERLRIVRNEKRLLGETENYVRSKNALYKTSKKSHPLTDDDEKQINEALKAIKATEDVIKRARQAGIDVDSQETQIKESEERLKGIKAAFFPPKTRR